MVKIFRKIFNYIKIYWYGMFYGLKSADEEIFGDINTSKNTTLINKRVESNRVSEALLRGEVTQEVEELRYRTYAVDRESKEYNYITPFLTEKREFQEDKHISYYNDENYELLLIQNNEKLQDNILDSFERLGKRGTEEKLISVKYNGGFMTRYNINKYLNRVVIRHDEKEGVFYTDLYVFSEPNDRDLTSKGFVNEIKRIKEIGKANDIIDINEIFFITSNAYGQKDMIKYVINDFNFSKISEFDGCYVITLSCNIKVNGKDLVEDYFSETMKEKYDNKVAKKPEVNIMDYMPIEYVCEECGKKVYYSPKDIEEMECYSADDPRAFTTNNTEYFDFQISEQTVGKRLCKDCFNKYLYIRD